jgi:two-component system sensor histidine kinase ResE
MHHGLPYSGNQVKDDFIRLGIDSDIKKVIETKESVFLQKDFEEKKLRFMLSPILNSSRNVTGVVALVSDISESERLEQLRRDFVANVSHEFRTPLTVIRGSLEAVMDGTVNGQEDVEQYHKKMLKEVKGLERLVGDLLDLSRLQSGNISVKKEKIYVPELLSDTIKSVQTLASKKDIRIDYSFPSGVPPVIGDYDRLRQLFIIFLDNAVKYSPEKTVISVGIILTQTLDIIIRDRGFGIDKKDLEFIWGRFYKSDKSRNSKGTGLGLAIAKELAALHNASLSMESELGKGTEVKIGIPFYA